MPRWALAPLAPAGARQDSHLGALATSRRERSGLGLLGTAALLGVLAAGCGERPPVQVGVVLPFTGPAAAQGRAVRRGLELAAAELALPSARGREIALETCDSEGDPETAARCARELLGAGALALVGGLGGGEQAALLPLAVAHRCALLVPGAEVPGASPSGRGASATSTSPPGYLYRLAVADDRQGAALAAFAVQRRRIATAVTVAAAEAPSRALQRSFAAEFARLGGQLLAAVEFATADELARLVETIVTLRPDAVYLAAGGDEIAVLVRALRAAGYVGHLYTASAFASPAALVQAGAAADGVFLAQAIFEPDGEDARIRDFVRRYRAAYGTPPDLAAAEGYDTMSVLAAAAAAGGDDPEALRRALATLPAMEGVTGPLRFDERGELARLPRVYVVDDRRLLDYERELEARTRAFLERLREIGPPSGPPDAASP